MGQCVREDGCGKGSIYFGYSGDLAMRMDMVCMDICKIRADDDMDGI